MKKANNKLSIITALIGALFITLAVYANGKTLTTIKINNEFGHSVQALFIRSEGSQNIIEKDLYMNAYEYIKSEKIPIGIYTIHVYDLNQKSLGVMKISISKKTKLASFGPFTLR